jgi:hypothetical protein
MVSNDRDHTLLSSLHSDRAFFVSRLAERQDLPYYNVPIRLLQEVATKQQRTLDLVFCLTPWAMDTLQVPAQGDSQTREPQSQRLRHDQTIKFENDKAMAPTIGLLAFISNIWTGFSATPSRRRRRTVYIDPDSIEPINHWFPGNRNKKQPRRLVETPTAGHWPEYRVAKKAVAKGRKRCGECGALVKEASAIKGRVAKTGGQSMKKSAANGKRQAARAVRSLRGRIVEYAG